MNGKLIALYSSAPQSGKSEVAKALESQGYQTFKFASALKDMLRSMFRSVGYGETQIEAFLDGHMKEKPIPEFGGKTPRFLMQTLGTDWGRNLIAGDLWIDILHIRVISALAAGHGVVVDDMRFPNEFGLLKYTMDAKTVWVKRPGVVARTTHPSEGLLDTFTFDREIINNSDLTTLRNTAYGLIQ
jgi:hypothetical protein